jgi:hypothetical protein
MHVIHTITAYTAVFLKMNPPIGNMYKISKLNIKILIMKMCISLVCVVQLSEHCLNADNGCLFLLRLCVSGKIRTSTTETVDE